MKNIKLYNLFTGDLDTIAIPVTTQTQNIQYQHRDTFSDFSNSLQKLFSMINNQKEFYASINDGCRAGSIVRIPGSQYRLKNDTTRRYTFGKLVSTFQPTNWVTVKVIDARSNYDMIIASSQLLESNIHYTARFQAQFDGRKSVSLSQDEHMSLEYLPDYQGPTVYCYARKSLTSEERAEIAKPDQFPVFDQIGEKIEIGELFFYGGANTLLIGKLIKVGKGGSLTYTSFVGRGSGRISTDLVRKCIRNGDKVPALLKFSKDLGDKLMLFKLSN